jgi:hypothetical protein
VRIIFRASVDMIVEICLNPDCTVDLKLLEQRFARILNTHSLNDLESGVRSDALLVDQIASMRLQADTAEDGDGVHRSVGEAKEPVLLFYQLRDEVFADADEQQNNENAADCATFSGYVLPHRQLEGLWER